MSVVRIVERRLLRRSANGKMKLAPESSDSNWSPRRRSWRWWSS